MVCVIQSEKKRMAVCVISHGPAWPLRDGPSCASFMPSVRQVKSPSNTLEMKPAELGTWQARLGKPSAARLDLVFAKRVILA